MQKSVIFVKETFKINMQKTKYFKVGGHCYYTGKNRGAAHSICNIKYSAPRKIPIDFLDG